MTPLKSAGGWLIPTSYNLLDGIALAMLRDVSSTTQSMPWYSWAKLGQITTACMEQCEEVMENYLEWRTIWNGITGER